MSLLRRLILSPQGQLRPTWRFLLVYLPGTFLLAVVLTALLLLPLVRSLNLDPFLLGEAGVAFVTLLTAALFCRWPGGITWAEVGWTRPREGGRWLALGLGMGIGMQLTLFLAFWAAGWLRILGPGSGGLGGLAYLALVHLTVAVAEETLSRGVALASLARDLGPTPALLLTSLAFALLHAGNPAFGLLPFLGILAAGLLLGWAYLSPGRIWLAAGIHWGWNLGEAALGFPVSGLPFPGLLSLRVQGPVLWTGGTFGPEGGLMGVLVPLTVGIGLALWSRRSARGGTHVRT